MKAAVRAALLASVVLLAIPASAGESGLPVGDLIFKPGVRIGFVYDSNVTAKQIDPEPDIGIEAQPYLGILYDGENFVWDFNLYYRLLQYANLNLTTTSHNAYGTFTQFGLTSAFDVNRKGKVGFYFAPKVENRLVRTGSEAEGAPPTAGGQNGSDYALKVALPFEFRLRPTKAVTVTPRFGYELGRYYFPIAPFAPNPAVLAQSHTPGGGLNIDWRFFPRSHLLVELGADYRHWEEGLDARYSQIPSVQFRGLAGIRGDITRKLSIMLMGGYGSSITIGEEANNLVPEGGILGRFEFAIRPITTQRLAFGFNRDFSNPFYARSQVDTRAYFKYKGLWFDRLGTQVDFAYTFRNLFFSDGTTNRDEHQIAAGVLIELMVAEWFHVDAQYRFTAIPTSTTDDAEFLDSRVTVGVTFGFK